MNEKFLHLWRAQCRPRIKKKKAKEKNKINEKELLKKPKKNRKIKKDNIPYDENRR